MQDGTVHISLYLFTGILTDAKPGLCFPASPGVRFGPGKGEDAK